MIEDFFEQNSVPKQQKIVDTITIDDESENDVDNNVEEVQPHSNEETVEMAEHNDDANQMADAGEFDQIQSNGIGHDEAVDPNEEIKENIRPQSTPLVNHASADDASATAALVINIVSTDTIPEQVESTSVANNEDEQNIAGPSKEVQKKKQYLCPKCNVFFTKKALLMHIQRNHMKRKQQRFIENNDIGNNNESGRYVKRQKIQ